MTPSFSSTEAWMLWKKGIKSTLYAREHLLLFIFFRCLGALLKELLLKKPISIYHKCAFLGSVLIHSWVYLWNNWDIEMQYRSDLVLILFSIAVCAFYHQKKEMISWWLLFSSFLLHLALSCDNIQIEQIKYEKPDTCQHWWAVFTFPSIPKTRFCSW